jgi:preprotein translocase subunit SecG
MQRPKQEGLGAAFGGGVTDQVFGARTTNVLQRGTVYLGSLFFVLSLTLAVLIGQKNKKTSMVVPKVEAKEAAKEQSAPAAPEIPAAPAPVAPAAPAPASEVPAAPAAPANTAPESSEKSGQP